MWMLSFIPDAILLWTIHIILLIGVVGVVASYTLFKFPFINRYRLPIQIISYLLVVVGIFFEGSYATEKSWRNRVAELQEKVAKSEAESKTANENIKTVYVDKVRVVKETQVVIQEKIKTVEVKIDSQCKITTDTVDILNDAAKGIKK
jgi:hypothetical protein